MKRGPCVQGPGLGEAGNEAMEDLRMVVFPTRANWTFTQHSEGKAETEEMESSGETSKASANFSPESTLLGSRDSKESKRKSELGLAVPESMSFA